MGANCSVFNPSLDTHVIRGTSDMHLQETADSVLERMCNSAPDGEWDMKESRNQCVFTAGGEKRASEVLEN